MGDSLGLELIHVTCGSCGKMTSFSLASLNRNSKPACPYCGEPIQVDLRKSEDDAVRQALELDESIDSLGSDG